MRCHGRQYSALLRELKALKRRYRSTDASSLSSEEPQDFSRLRLDKLLGESLIFAPSNRLPISLTINHMNHYVGQLGLQLLYMPTLQHQSSINQSTDQYAYTHLKIRIRPPCSNLHTPTLQYARAHLTVICTCPPCIMHVPTLQYARAHLAICTRPPCNVQAPTGTVSSSSRSHCCLHDHAVTDPQTQPTLLMSAKTQRNLNKSISCT